MRRRNSIQRQRGHETNDIAGHLRSAGLAIDEQKLNASESGEFHRKSNVKVWNDALLLRSINHSVEYGPDPMMRANVVLQLFSHLP